MRPVQLTFENLLTSQYTAVVEAMQRVLAAEMVEVARILQPLAGLFVLITFLRWGLGWIDWKHAAQNGGRMLLVGMLIGGQGLYQGPVRAYVMDHIPNTFARVTTGTTGRMAAAAQYDTVSLAAENLAAEIRERNTSWSIAAVQNAAANVFANGAFQFWLSVQAAVWLTSIRLMAIALCIGPWLLLLEIFDGTRGAVRAWIGVLGGLLVFQLASGVFLQISLHSLMAQLRAIQAAGRMRGVTVDEMVANLLHIGSAVFVDAMTMLALPTVCAVFGGIGTHMAAGYAARNLPGAAQRAYERGRAGYRLRFGTT